LCNDTGLVVVGQEIQPCLCGEPDARVLLALTEEQVRLIYEGIEWLYRNSRHPALMRLEHGKARHQIYEILKKILRARRLPAEATIHEKKAGTQLAQEAGPASMAAAPQDAEAASPQIVTATLRVQQIVTAIHAIRSELVAHIGPIQTEKTVGFTTQQFPVHEEVAQWQSVDGIPVDEPIPFTVVKGVAK
jgi:hypothetical protein